MDFKKEEERAWRDLRVKGREFFYSSPYGRLNKNRLDELFSRKITDKSSATKILLLCVYSAEMAALSDDSSDELLADLAESRFIKMFSQTQS